MRPHGAAVGRGEGKHLPREGHTVQPGHGPHPVRAPPILSPLPCPRHPHPILGALFPQLPIPCFSTFHAACTTNVPPAKRSWSLGLFLYCPGLSLLNAKLASFPGSPLCGQMAPMAPPYARPTHQARLLPGPLQVAHCALSSSSKAPTRPPLILGRMPALLPDFVLNCDWFVIVMSSMPPRLGQVRLTQLVFEDQGSALGRKM